MFAKRRFIGPPSDTDWLLLVHAKMNKSKVPVVVLQQVYTSEFIVVPIDELELHFKPNPKAD